MHIWGCFAEGRLYIPHKSNLDPRIINYFFIGYPKRSKRYRFYYPNHHTRIVEINNAKFLKNGISSESHDKKSNAIT